MTRTLSTWRRRSWALAWPIILSNLSVPLLGAVDTAVTGHMPDPSALGAVAVGAMIFDFVYWGFGFLRMSTTAFTARAVGEEDGAGLRTALGQPLVMGVIAGLGLLLLQGPICAAALTLVESSPEVEAQARLYFEARILGAPAVLMNYALLGWLLGTQNARGALIHQVTANGVNIGLDLWLVYGLGQGVEGVALATALAQYAAVIPGVWLVRRGLRPWPGPWQVSRWFDRQAMARVWAVNRDIFLRTLGLIGAFAWFTTRGAAQGEVILAANAVLLNLQTLMAYGLDGFAHAAEALVGEQLGRRDAEGIRGAIRATTEMAGGVAAAFTALYLIAGDQVVALLTDLPEVRLAASEHLIWAAVAPILSVWAFQLDGIFIGAARTAEMRNAMLLSVALFLAATPLALTTWGNHGLWAVFVAFMALRALTLGAYLPRLLGQHREAHS